MLSRIGYAALGAYGLSILGAVMAPTQTDGDSRPVPMRRAGHTLSEPPLRGFAISLHHTEHLHLYLQAIDEMVELGFNCLEVTTPVFQTNGQAQEIHIKTGPGGGPERWQLVALLHHASQRRLTTALMPQILFTAPRGNEWRGKIHPAQWDPWWKHYQRVIDYFLDVANEASVDIFCVGSELLSTERQAHRWTRLIQHTRRRFGGQLTYSTNWDHYHIPTIWRDLDMIGISGYWDLSVGTGQGSPTLDQLTHRWQNIRRKVLSFAAAHRRPILFTEIGYPSLPWAIKDPWNYIRNGQVNADHRAQAMGYASFLTAWDDLLRHQHDPTQLRGVFFYAWDPYHHGGEQDTGYGVRGKPALDLLKHWLAEPH